MYLERKILHRDNSISVNQIWYYCQCWYAAYLCFWDLTNYDCKCNPIHQAVFSEANVRGKVLYLSIQ